MPLIETKIDRDNEDFQQNSAANVALAEQLREKITQSVPDG